MNVCIFKGWFLYFLFLSLVQSFYISINHIISCSFSSSQSTFSFDEIFLKIYSNFENFFVPFRLRICVKFWPNCAKNLTRRGIQKHRVLKIKFVFFLKKCGLGFSYFLCKKHLTTTCDKRIFFHTLRKIFFAIFSFNLKFLAIICCIVVLHVAKIRNMKMIHPNGLQPYVEQTNVAIWNLPWKKKNRYFIIRLGPNFWRSAVP